MMALAPCPRNTACMRNAGHRGDCSRGIFRPLTSPATTSGGTAVSDIQQAKASLMHAAQELTEGAGHIQGGHGKVETARTFLMSAAEGTSQDGFDECMALISAAEEKTDEAQQACLVAAKTAESMAARA